MNLTCWQVCSFLFSIVAAQQGADNIKLWKDDSGYLWAHNASNATIVQVSAAVLVCDSRGTDLKFTDADTAAGQEAIKKSHAARP